MSNMHDGDFFVKTVLFGNDSYVEFFSDSDVSKRIKVTAFKQFVGKLPLE